MFSRRQVVPRLKGRRHARPVAAVIAAIACAIATVIALPGAAPAAAASTAPIFTIGTPDQSDAEFALAPGSYLSYSSAFPNDVNFTVGTSNTATAWSYIQPGPVDTWAGSKVHPFTINYTLAAVPTTDLVLHLSYLDSHQYSNTTTPTVWTTVEADSNGSKASTAQVARGADVGKDSTTGVDPQRIDLTIPASTLRAGSNSLVIKNTTGSWTVYDAVSLAPAVTASIPRPDHVVIVMMENEDYSTIIGNTSQAPYINSLAAAGASFSDSHGVWHPSLPNYYALLSGSTQGLINSNNPPAGSINADNLPHELLTHGPTTTQPFGFADYSDEAVPAAWLRFADLPGTSTAPNLVDKWLSCPPTVSGQGCGFPSTTAGYAALPAVTFAHGNGAESMHDGNIPAGDTWVQNTFGGYATWAKDNNSLLIVTFDEDDFHNANHIPTVFYGANVNPGSYSETINHYSVLRTIEDMYGLPHLANDATAPEITDAWTVNPPATGGVVNGGFESGTFSGWTTSGTASVVNSGAHSGTYAAQLGATTPTNGDSSATQTFTAPTGSTALSFWYKVTCPDTVQYDWATATLTDNTAGTTTTPLARTCTTSTAWTQVSSPITAGHSYTLTLISHDDGYAGDPTYTLYDDVALTGSAAGNTYKLVNHNSGEVLAVSDVTQTNGGSIVQAVEDGTAAQNWKLSTDSAGYTILTNAVSSSVLDVPGNSPTQGTQLDQWPANGGTNQEWTLTPATTSGYYTLTSHSSGQLADVSGASTSAGAPVIQWPATGGSNQEWQLVATP